MFANLFNFGDEFHAAAKGWPAFFCQHVESKNNVVGGHRLSVRPFCFRIEREFYPCPLIIRFDFLGQQPIHCEWLVCAPLHQRFIDKISKLRVAKHASGICSHAFHQKRVEAIECADNAVGDRTALRRFGINVGKIFVIGGQGWFAVHGDFMGWFSRYCACHRTKRGQEGQCLNGFLQHRLNLAPKSRDLS